MGEATKRLFDDQNLEGIDNSCSHVGTWMIMKCGDGVDGGDDDIYRGSELTKSFLDDLMNSESSELDSETEMTENTSSFSFSSSSTTSLTCPLSDSNDNGSLYELSELMIHLPIKRGLSKHYEGKSQSYVSLASVKSVEDLAKKDESYTNRNKSCKSKSYAHGFEGHKFYAPKATISKKTQRAASFLSLLGNNNNISRIRSTSTNSFKSPIFSISNKF